MVIIEASGILPEKVKIAYINKFRSSTSQLILKLHNGDIPLRLIVSALGSPTHEVAKFLARKLQAFIGKTGYTLNKFITFC